VIKWGIVIYHIGGKMKKVLILFSAIIMLAACTPPEFPDTPVVNSDYKVPETTKPNIFNTEKNEAFSSVEGYTKMIDFGTDGSFDWDDLYVDPEDEEEIGFLTETTETTETTPYEEEVVIEIDLDREWALFKEEYTATTTTATFTTPPPLDMSHDPDASLFPPND
jgi:hypothetical protein